MEVLINAAFIAAIIGVILGPDWMVQLTVVAAIAGGILAFELLRADAYSIFFRVLTGYLFLAMAMAVRAGTDLINKYSGSADRPSRDIDSDTTGGSGVPIPIEKIGSNRNRDREDR